MYMAEKKTFTHTEDVALAKRFDKFIDEHKDLSKDQKWALKYHLTRNTWQGAHDLPLSDEDKYHGVVQGLGCLMMNASFYDPSHRNYTDHDKLFTEIKNQFKDIPCIVEMCTEFLKPGRSYEDTSPKIRKLTWDNCVDWTK